MEFRRLGRSGLKVSAVGLGTNSFGSRADEATSLDIMNRALEAGINFLDTADIYSQGRSEEIIGKALKGRRSQVILATKFGYPTSVRPHEQGGSRSFVLNAVNASLKRLDTDYIDLYYFHYPDPATPIEETLRALDDLVREGKVRYTGCSNFPAWQLCEAHWVSRVNGLVSFIAAQPRYNLLDRTIERELAPCCRSYGVGVVPWGPLAAGFLTGKYAKGREMPAGARLANPPSIYGDILNEPNFDKLARLEAYAGACGHTVRELAIAWLLAHDFLGSVIAGATSPDHVSANAAAVDWKLTAGEVAEIEKLL